MKKILLLFLIGTILIACNQKAVFVRGAWTKGQASEWYKQWGRPHGCDFISSTVVNQVEMQQTDAFDPVIIDRELGWAEDIGINCMRVYLHHLVWETNKEDFEKRINEYLITANKHHISTIFAFLDDCWNPTYQAGEQPKPQPGVHNSGWARDPGGLYYKGDTTAILPVSENYMGNILVTFKNGKKIMLWNLHNGPSGSGGYRYGERGLSLLQKIFMWGRTVNPSQPLPAGIRDTSLTDLNKFQLENPDVITYHTYGDLNSHQQPIDTLRQYGRLMICTEYMAHIQNNTFQDIMPMLKKENVGAINWGLVTGRTNMVFVWDTPLPDVVESPLWFHDILRSDGTLYSAEKVECIHSLTK